MLFPFLGKDLIHAYRQIALAAVPYALRIEGPLPISKTLGENVHNELGYGDTAPVCLPAQPLVQLLRNLNRCSLHRC
jgi:hypothetical protein